MKRIKQFIFVEILPRRCIRLKKAFLTTKEVTFIFLQTSLTNITLFILLLEVKMDKIKRIKYANCQKKSKKTTKQNKKKII